MQISISPRIAPVYCRGQELSVDVVCECKCSAVIAQLTKSDYRLVTESQKKFHISGFEIVHHTLKINVNAYVSDQNCNAFLKK